MTYHFGRSWSGTRLEDECPCPKAPCGLVTSDVPHTDCEQHGLQYAKTMRQSHPAENCPGRIEAQPPVS